MKKCLVLYRSAVSSRAQMANATPEQAKAGMDAWMQWATKNAASVLDLGAPLGSGTHLKGNGTASADDTISGFSIVQGESLDSVKKMFSDHPHKHMPGEASIEIFEVLAIPGM